jgi:RND family efflux transporter MFP subunit
MTINMLRILSSSRSRLRSAPALLRAAALVTLFGPLGGCQWGSVPAEKTKPKPTEVVFETPIVKLVTEREEFTGRTVAVENVEIRARVSGYLEKILFKEGEDVRAGQPLFEIDSRPYKAEFDRASAVVSQLAARVEKLKGQEQRAQKLLAMRSISQEDFDTVMFDRTEAESGLAAAVATKDVAALNLGHCHITAKISGRISRQLVDVGNLVQADITPLARIVSLDPMYAYFDLDERTVLRLQRLIQGGKIASARDTDIPIRVALADEDDYTLTARFNFVDNQVDPATGTLLARAELSNASGMLSPGLFVRLQVPIGEPKNAMLIHEEALGTDQGQRFVYVVNDENKVEYRRVKVGWLDGDRRVIEEGLQAGDRVVLTNLQRIRPQDEVVPKPAAPAENVAAAAVKPEAPRASAHANGGAR